MTAPGAIAPPRIARGATLGVIAPAGPVRPERVARGLARLGDAFAIRLAPSLSAPRAPDVPSYLAASDDQRIDELSTMLRDPDVRAIAMARGGYGITRILPRLDPDLVRRDPKPIVGFSDGTALLAWAHAAGVRGIHGPVIAQLGDLDPLETERLITLLTDPTPPPPWRLDPAGARGGIRRGAVVPANLTLATMLVGTPWALPLDGVVVLFEEVGERPYELDRYLTQLIQTSPLPRAAAVVLGDLTRCDDPAPATGEPDPPDAALRVFRERIASIDLPLVAGAPVGHGTRNAALPFGAACELDVERGTLAILEGAVS